jgi:hypothetical protein
LACVAIVLAVEQELSPARPPEVGGNRSQKAGWRGRIISSRATIQARCGPLCVEWPTASIRTRLQPAARIVRADPSDSRLRPVELRVLAKPALPVAELVVVLYELDRSAGT